ncbi:hypothetical protein Hypma_000469 [Hypsizygus marmoreus]|uniref:Uncharacterized protein n=1 Tax=Hypsizygus marmoreus TaxID=39966 RepID=A0A369JBY9_HYPMA|nr:hypothetical protein Hypma_000469 [Hypsizygus marmoreus]
MRNHARDTVWDLYPVTPTPTPAPWTKRQETSSEIDGITDPTGSSSDSSSSSSSESSTSPPPSSSSTHSSDSSSSSSSSSSSTRSPPPSSSSEPPPESESHSSSSSDTSSEPSQTSDTPTPSESDTSSHEPSQTPSPTPTPTPTPTTTTTPLQPSESLTPTPSPSESFTTITTVVDGTPTTFTSALPTSLSTSPPSKSGQTRTAIIAGSTVAGILVLLAILAGIFLYRRHSLKLYDEIQHILHPKRARREGRGLLEGEDFFDEDDEDAGVALRAYRDLNSNSTAHGRTASGSALGVHGRNESVARSRREASSPVMDMSRSGTPQSAAPSLYRARGSETGSLFREDVWPPPGPGSQLVDPFLGNVRPSRDVGLTKIVDDVMGPDGGGATKNAVASSSAMKTATPSSSPATKTAATSSSPPDTSTITNPRTSYMGLGAHAPLVVTNPSDTDAQSLYIDPFSSSMDASSVYLPAIPPLPAKSPPPSRTQRAQSPKAMSPVSPTRVGAASPGLPPGAGPSLMN